MPRPYSDTDFADSFWKRVDKSGDCWTWTGACTSAGYGILTRHRKNIYAHRVSYELINGPIPEGLCVLHHCDHPSCVHPEHLFLGTISDNNRDMAAKHRSNSGAKSGEQNPLAKLSEDDVRLMRQLYQPGVRGYGLQAIAKRFGVSKATAHEAISHQTWQHIS